MTRRAICTSANLIVGTTNNNAPIQMVTKKVAQSLIKPGKEPDQGILNMIEMAFRAFDPCYSCATHSLPRADAAPGRRVQGRRALPRVSSLLLSAVDTVRHAGSAVTSGITSADDRERPPGARGTCVP